MAIPTDTLLGRQWHLGNVPGLFDLNVRKAWEDYTGAGVTVAVIDDGFDYRHPDLAPNYLRTRDHDFADRDTDAFGDPADDDHGTAVAGLIAADDNGTGAVGVAFDARLIGYRTGDLLGDEWLGNIRDAIAMAADNADVANISQAISNDIDSVFGGGGYRTSLFNEIGASIADAVENGRDGRGTIIVKAAGNARNDGDGDGVNDNYDVNADPWGNDTRMIAVAAVDQDGTVSGYSSFGASVLVSAFGTMGTVVTTDRLDDNGYNTSLDFKRGESRSRDASPSDPDFTFRFNGTSAAAPMVSGVTALMLEANPNLGWRDVQDILAYSARHVGSPVDGRTTDGIERTPWTWNAATDWNGGGLHFSNDYGFGLVDATAAVRLAESWTLFDAPQTSWNQYGYSADGLDRSVTIPDGSAAGMSFALRGISPVEVERMVLDLQFSTTAISDLEVYLTSPDGTTSELIRDVAQGNAVASNDFSGWWRFESQAFRGESSSGEAAGSLGGTWTVRSVDDTAGNTLRVSDMVLTALGHAAYGFDNFIFTDEYSDYDGIAGHRTTITDTFGVDSVNTAAVTSASTINLAGGASSIDGVAVTLRGIEHAVGGDGNDQMTGSTGENRLYGMRGNDTLNGGGGRDSLIGGLGFDTMDGGTGADRFEFLSVEELGLPPARFSAERTWDWIRGFEHGVDTIDLSAIFITNPDGSIENLHFAPAFTGDAGELVISREGSTANYWVDGDLNGDRTADFALRVTMADARSALTASDFVFFELPDYVPDLIFRL